MVAGSEPKIRLPILSWPLAVVDAKKTLQSAQTTLVMTNAAKNQLKKEIKQVLSSSSS